MSKNVNMKEGTIPGEFGGDSEIGLEKSLCRFLVPNTPATSLAEPVEMHCSGDPSLPPLLLM